MKRPDQTPLAEFRVQKERKLRCRKQTCIRVELGGEQTTELFRCSIEWTRHLLDGYPDVVEACFEEGALGENKVDLFPRMVEPVCPDKLDHIHMHFVHDIDVVQRSGDHRIESLEVCDGVVGEHGDFAMAVVHSDHMVADCMLEAEERVCRIVVVDDPGCPCQACQG